MSQLLAPEGVSNRAVQRTGASRFAQRQIERHRRLAPVADLCVSCDVKVAFGTAWLDENPDQALRVAAGILEKRASDWLWPSGHYCQGCEAFPTRYRTWEPQSGVGLELEEMVKTN